uniref:CoA-binding protein n=1 Tax=Fervidobacterium thailandense TaxID=1008305 RepID=A0A7C4GBK3_9BACT
MIKLGDVKKVAIIGATVDREKYGNIILRDLRSKGYQVIPVNPKYAEIEGIPVVKDVTELPKDVDLIIFVVPPQVGIEQLEKAYQVGFRKFWFQPGAESEAIVELSKKLRDAEFSFIRCIMVETSSRHSI